MVASIAHLYDLRFGSTTITSCGQVPLLFRTATTSFSNSTMCSIEHGLLGYNQREQGRICVLRALQFGGHGFFQKILCSARSRLHRVAYVSVSRALPEQSYQLVVADADGMNPRVVSNPTNLDVAVLVPVGQAGMSPFVEAAHRYVHELKTASGAGCPLGRG